MQKLVVSAADRKHLRRGFAAHGVAAAIAYLVLGFVPSLLSWSTWTLTSLLGGDGGVHVYAVGFSFDDQQSEEVAAQTIATSARLLGVAILGIYCAAGEWSLRRWRASIVLTPVLPALLASGFAAWPHHTTDMPPSAPSILALAVGFVVFLIVGSYWFTLRAARLLLQRAGDGTDSPRRA